MGFELSVNHRHTAEPNSKCPSVEVEFLNGILLLGPLDTIPVSFFGGVCMCELHLKLGAPDPIYI